MLPELAENHVLRANKGMSRCATDRPRSATLWTLFTALTAPALALAVACSSTPPANNASGASSDDSRSSQDDPPLTLEKTGTQSTAAPTAKTQTKKGGIKLVPDGMRWGMNREELENLVDKFIDDDYKEKLKKTSNPRLAEDLASEIANKKRVFRRTFIDLTGSPTGLDSQPVAAEFTKGNEEAIMVYERGPGVRIYFLFIKGKLWRTFEDVKLVAGGLYGKDMSEAADKIVSANGDPAGVLPKDPAKNRAHDTIEWDDGLTHMRVYSPDNVNISVVREDRSTLANLSNLRKNTAAPTTSAGAGVDSFLRGNDPPKKDTPPPKK